MAANKKNNINVDRPIIQSSGYNGSEPVRICPNCNKPKPISEFGFRKMGNGQIRNQSWMDSIASSSVCPRCVRSSSFSSDAGRSASIDAS